MKSFVGGTTSINWCCLSVPVTLSYFLFCWLMVGTKLFSWRELWFSINAYLFNYFFFLFLISITFYWIWIQIVVKKESAATVNFFQRLCFYSKLLQRRRRILYILALLLVSLVAISRFHSKFIQRDWFQILDLGWCVRRVGFA